MKTTAKIPTLAILMAIGSGFANADSLPIHNYFVSLQTVAFTQTVSIDKFDHNLGTLTDVRLDVSANFLADFFAYNFTAGALSFTEGYGTGSASVTGPSGFSVTLTSQTPHRAGTVAAQTSPDNPGIVTFSSETASANSVSHPSNLSDYIFTGGVNPLTLDLTFLGNSFDVSGTGSGLFYGAEGGAGGTIGVTYTYTNSGPATPEPASMALMGSALLGLGLFGKKLKKFKKA